MLRCKINQQPPGILACGNCVRQLQPGTRASFLIGAVASTYLMPD
jgi:hypothetical protein